MDSRTDFPTLRLIDYIIGATQHEEIFDVLPRLGFRRIAERLKYLHKTTSDDDPEDPSMTLSSLRQLALFFASDRPSIGDPEIGISPDGCLQAEWLMSMGGLAMKFLSTELIQFAAISKSIVDGNRLSVYGTLPKYQALQALRPFISEERPE